MARNTSNVYNRTAVLDNVHLFFQTIEGADHIYIDQFGEVFWVEICDGEDAHWTPRQGSYAALSCNDEAW